MAGEARAAALRAVAARPPAVDDDEAVWQRGGRLGVDPGVRQAGRARDVTRREGGRAADVDHDEVDVAGCDGGADVGGVGLVGQPG